LSDNLQRVFSEQITSTRTRFKVYSVVCVCLDQERVDAVACLSALILCPVRRLQDWRGSGV